MTQGPSKKKPAISTRVAVFRDHGGLADQGVFLARLYREITDMMTSEVAAGF